MMETDESQVSVALKPTLFVLSQCSMLTIALLP